MQSHLISLIRTLVNTMPADALAPGVTKASATMLLALWEGNILASLIANLNKLWNFSVKE